MSRRARRIRGSSNWVVWALAAAFSLAALASAVVVFSAVREVAASWNQAGLPSFQLVGRPSSDSTPLPGETPTIPLVADTPVPWNGTDRVTILLMGLDFRDWESGDGPPRTDSMMLVSVDPVSHTVGMLSIPRDLWVEIPGGFGHNRINTAYFLGESYKLPGGGPDLAMKTVENLLGLPVQYYAVIEFQTFERMIDEIGGIDILVEENVKISPIGRPSRWLRPKAYHMDGPTALAYARARKTEGGDFDRADRQQRVALAIRDRIFYSNMAPTLLAKAPALYQELASGVHTNLTLNQMVGLGLLLIQIPPENIHRGTIAPPDMVALETLPTGADVLKPNPDQIRILRDELFTSTGAIGPSASSEEPGSAAELEQARVAVRNGAGIEGLATQTSDFLKQQGLNIVEIGNADRLDYGKSRLLIYRDTYPYTVSYLASLLQLSDSQILLQSAPDSPVDMALILGSDWQVPH
jgi:LCP family protein required for cell wall assembly